MKQKNRHRRRDLTAYNPERLPEILPPEDDRYLVQVYVEGYEDVAFWRGIFDHFRNPYLRFEISVPNRDDLPKGKKVLMSMLDKVDKERVLLCVDSDFDYLFAGETEQSERILNADNMFHTYTYATENYLCYAPSLRNVCVKATKNDTRIFDFVRFMAAYSEIIYPLFLWYVYSARHSTENVFTLAEFRAAVRLGYVDIRHNGEGTLAWLQRNVERRHQALINDNPEMCEAVEKEIYKCCFDRVKTVTCTKQVLDKEGNVHELTETKQVALPADGRAQRYWLNNRNPARWRDKVEVAVEAVEGGTIALPAVELIDGEGEDG